MASITLPQLLATLCACGQTRPVGAARCDACERDKYTEAKSKEATNAKP
jgi:hypothetical protein